MEGVFDMRKPKRKTKVLEVRNPKPARKRGADTESDDETETKEKDDKTE